MDLVWPCIHGCIYFLHSGICDKPKTSGALGFGISHYHTVCKSFPIAQNGSSDSHRWKLKPPMKSFSSCSSSLGDSDLDMTAVGRETLMMLTRQCPQAERSYLMNLSLNYVLYADNALLSFSPNLSPELLTYIQLPLYISVSDCYQDNKESIPKNQKQNLTISMLYLFLLLYESLHLCLQWTSHHK